MKRFDPEKTKSMIVETCLASRSLSPLELGTELMAREEIRMHGPEHHFLVSAAFCAAWYRAEGRDPEPHLEKLWARCRTIAPGVCGYYGVCGAVQGAGAFLSEALGITYLSGDSWVELNRFTARVQQAVAESCTRGPRCCKRSTFAVLEAGTAALNESFGRGLEESVPHCAFSGRNGQCIGKACRFFEGRTQE